MPGGAATAAAAFTATVTPSLTTGSAPVASTDTGPSGDTATVTTRTGSAGLPGAASRSQPATSMLIVAAALALESGVSTAAGTLTTKRTAPGVGSSVRTPSTA